MYGKHKLKRIVKRHKVSPSFAKQYAEMKEEYPHLTMWAYKLHRYHPKFQGKDIQEAINKVRRKKDRQDGFVSDIENNDMEFDNLFGRKRRRKLFSKLKRFSPAHRLHKKVMKRMPRKIRRLDTALRSGGVSGVMGRLNWKRKKLNSRHSKIIKALGGAIRNPRKRARLQKAVAKMGGRINRLNKNTMGWTKFFSKHGKKLTGIRQISKPPTLFGTRYSSHNRGGLGGVRGYNLGDRMKERIKYMQSDDYGKPHRKPIGRPNPYAVGGALYGQDPLLPTPSYIPADRLGRGADLISDSQFSNATGNLQAKLKKNKWLVIGGVAVVVLFFTPFGKKLMKGKS